MAQTYPVNIDNMAFDPASQPVKKGDTVTWTNQMAMSHTIKPDHNEFPGSGPIAGGHSFSHVFDATGTVAYHCEIHPHMKGTVIVTD